MAEPYRHATHATKQSSNASQGTGPMSRNTITSTTHWCRVLIASAVGGLVACGGGSPPADLQPGIRTNVVGVTRSVEFEDRSLNIVRDLVVTADDQLLAIGDRGICTVIGGADHGPCERYPIPNIGSVEAIAPRDLILSEIWGEPLAARFHEGKIVWKFDARQSSVLGVIRDGPGRDVVISTLGDGLVFLDVHDGHVIRHVDAPPGRGVTGDFDGDGTDELVLLPSRGPMEVRDSQGRIKLRRELGFAHSFPIASHGRMNISRLFISSDTALIELTATIEAKQTWLAPDAPNLNVVAAQTIRSVSGDYAAFLLAGRGGWHRTVFYIYDPSGRLVYREILGDDCRALCVGHESTPGEVGILVGGRNVVWRYVVARGP